MIYGSSYNAKKALQPLLTLLQSAPARTSANKDLAEEVSLIGQSFLDRGEQKTAKEFFTQVTRLFSDGKQFVDAVKGLIEKHVESTLKSRNNIDKELINPEPIVIVFNNLPGLEKLFALMTALKTTNTSSHHHIAQELCILGSELNTFATTISNNISQIQNNNIAVELVEIKYFIKACYQEAITFADIGQPADIVHFHRQLIAANFMDNKATDDASDTFRSLLDRLNIYEAIPTNKQGIENLVKELCLLGSMFEEQAKIDKAITCYRLAIQFAGNDNYSDSSQAYSQLIDTYYRHKQTNDAETVCNEFLTKLSKSENICANATLISNLYKIRCLIKKQGNQALAAKCFKMALKLFNDENQFETIINGYAQIIHDCQNSSDKAEKHFTELRTLLVATENNLTYIEKAKRRNRIGKIFTQKQVREQAAQCFQQAVSFANQSDDITIKTVSYVNLIILQSILDKHDDAQITWDILVKQLDSINIDLTDKNKLEAIAKSLLNLGHLFYDQKKYNEVEKCFLQAIKFSNNMKICVSGYQDLILSHYTLGNVPKAENVLQGFLEKLKQLDIDSLDNETLETVYSIGNNLFKKTHYKEAEDVFSQLTKVSTNIKCTFNGYARVYIIHQTKLKNYKRANEILKKIFDLLKDVKIDSLDTEMRNHLANQMDIAGNTKLDSNNSFSEAEKWFQYSIDFATDPVILFKSQLDLSKAVLQQPKKRTLAPWHCLTALKTVVKHRLSQQQLISVLNELLENYSVASKNKKWIKNITHTLGCFSNAWDVHKRPKLYKNLLMSAYEAIDGKNILAIRCLTLVYQYIDEQYLKDNDQSTEQTPLNQTRKKRWQDFFKKNNISKESFYEEYSNLKTAAESNELYSSLTELLSGHPTAMVEILKQLGINKNTINALENRVNDLEQKLQKSEETISTLAEKNKQNEARIDDLSHRLQSTHEQMEKLLQQNTTSKKRKRTNEHDARGTFKTKKAKLTLFDPTESTNTNEQSTVIEKSDTFGLDQ